MKLGTLKLSPLSILLAASFGIVSLTTLAQAQDVHYQSSSSSRKALLKNVKKAFAKKGVSAIPDTSDLAQKYSKKKSGTKSNNSRRILTVGGTPPKLTDIPGTTIKNLFWEDGLIDALGNLSPTPSQCNQYFYGSEDGKSGGVGACHMAESVGYSFQSVLESGASLCYMRNFPTPANLAAGGVTLVSGSFPAGGISRIFAPPAGEEARIIKVAVSGSPNQDPSEDAGEQEEQDESQDVFLKIYSAKTNTNNGNMYQADLWFCNSGSSTVTGADLIVISNSGRITINSSGTRGEDSHVNEVEGYLTIGSNVVGWDTSRTRTSQVVSSRGSDFFKGLITVTAQNLLKVKSYDSFNGHENKRYSVSRFSGSDAASLRFLEGSFKELNSFSSSVFEGATEYRNGTYVSAPANSLIPQLDDVDFSSDGFYSEANIDQDLSEFSCDTAADIEINMDMSNSTLQSSVQECMSTGLQGMHFCHDDSDVSRAEESYFSACLGQNSQQ